MRCTQMCGLPRKARKFLAANREEVYCKACGQATNLNYREYGPIVGMFDEEALLEYDLKRGGVAREERQFEIWSSGPMIFLRLRIYERTKDNTLVEVDSISWTTEELRDYIDEADAVNFGVMCE